LLIVGNMNKIRYVVFGAFIALAITATTLITLRARRAEAKRQACVPILMYHEIGARADSPWCVPEETFRAQMASLREQGFQTILPSDLAAHLRRGKPLPRKPIVLTFDDGYLSNLNIVEPILKEHGFRALVYLITSQVAETTAGRKQYEGKDCLVWPEALAMQKRRIIAFGGHAHTHNNLAVDGQAAFQITECYRQLARHGISAPYAFCYPHGQQNQATRRLVREAGFQTAVVCEDTVALIAPAVDLFALPRVSVMGGKHDFRLIAGEIDVEKRALAGRILHSGIPIEISAGLCLRGQEPIWLPAREVGGGEFELRFVLPENTSRDAIDRIEIRDKHRLFTLATITPPERQKQ
jgi:peptidoglycan/xylan/chitin deacetylase (PgdA/CDA1 family)